MLREKRHLLLVEPAPDLVDELDQVIHSPNRPGDRQEMLQRAEGLIRYFGTVGLHADSPYDWAKETASYEDRVAAFIAQLDEKKADSH